MSVTSSEGAGRTGQGAELTVRRSMHCFLDIGGLGCRHTVGVTPDAPPPDRRELVRAYHVQHELPVPDWANSEGPLPSPAVIAATVGRSAVAAGASATS